MSDASTANIDRDPHFIGWLPMPRYLVLASNRRGAIVLTGIAAVVIAGVSRPEKDNGRIRRPQHSKESSTRNRTR
jgi:hypothetical protein